MYRLLLQKIKDLKKAYSLLEVLITLVIVNIILLMVSNILVLSLKISIQAHERSKAREELTNIVNLIRRDIRNANSVTQIENESELKLNAQVQNLIWKPCEGSPDQICKYITTVGNPNLIETYRSHQRLKITDLSFIEQESDLYGGYVNYQISILMTIQADHTIESYNIHNLYRQVLISTRNYPQ